MQISSKGRYGLMIMTELASEFGKGPVLAETIGKQTGISTNYVRNIVSILKNAGLVRILRGAKGGYELSRPPSKTTTLDVLTTLEGVTLPADCKSGGKHCPREWACSVKDVWVQVGNAVEKVLGAVTLEDLAESQKRKSEKTIMFYI